MLARGACCRAWLCSWRLLRSAPPSLWMSIPSSTICAWTTTRKNLCDLHNCTSRRFCSTSFFGCTPGDAPRPGIAADHASPPSLEEGASKPVEDAASASSPVPTAKRKIQIAVVGSGPSGCFLATYLTKKNADIHVDLYERLPVPYGLCRYGVAPDHPEVKNVESQFMKLFKSGKVTWIGNVNIGKEIPIEAMLQHYAAVVIATGASNSRRLDIPGADLGGVICACDLVNYYSTLPFPYGSPHFCPFDLERTHKVVMIGNGNVAMDTARVLSAPYKYFCTTDMNCAALKEFMKNRIHSIDIVARRGVEHSAFAIAEFRELTGFQEETVKVSVDAFDLGSALVAPGITNARAHKRLMELIHRFSIAPEALEAERRAMATDANGAALSHLAAPPAAGPTSFPPPAPTPPVPLGDPPRSGRSLTRGSCAVRFRYHLKPLRFLPSAGCRNRVGGVLFERTDTAAVGGGTGLGTQYCVLPCDMVLLSIGYSSDQIPEVPFDAARGVIPNARGRVLGVPRVYCSGWVKNGAKGVILNSMVDAQETAAVVLEDLARQEMPAAGADLSGKYGLLDYFVAKRLELVSIGGLQRILQVEKERGVDLGKRAEKLDNVRDMLDIALGGGVGKKTSERIRGIEPERPAALLYLKELLDDDTDLAPFAKELVKEMPRRMADWRHDSPVAPFQL